MANYIYQGQSMDEKIYSRLKQMILGGGLNPLEKMPDPYDLAGQLSVSPNMILYIYNLLEKEELLYCRSKREVFVCDNDKIAAMKRIIIEDEMIELMKQAQGYGIRKEELVSMLSRQQEETAGAWDKEEGNK